MDSKPECNSASSCALCDALETPFYTAPAEVAGKVALVGIELRGVRELPTGRSQYMVAVTDRCLYPWSNLVEQLEAMGARAVLFVNGEGEGVLTLEERGWSAEVGIPAFNVGLEAGAMLASVMKYGSVDPYLFGTSLEMGLRLTLPDSEGLLPFEAVAGGSAAGTANPTDVGGAGGGGGGGAAGGTEVTAADEGETPFERDVTIFSTTLGSSSEDAGEDQGRGDLAAARLYIGLASGIALCLAVGTWAYFHAAQSRRLGRFMEIEEGGGLAVALGLRLHGARGRARGVARPLPRPGPATRRTRPARWTPWGPSSRPRSSGGCARFFLPLRGPPGARAWEPRVQTRARTAAVCSPDYWLDFILLACGGRRTRPRRPRPRSP